MYKWKSEPETKEERSKLLNVAFWVVEQLSEEERNSTNEEYNVYRDSEHEKRNEIYPWYIWIAKRVEVKLR